MTEPAIAGVAAAVAAALAAALWAVLRRRAPERIESAEDAAAAVEAAIATFSVAGAVVGSDGAGALAVAEDGRVAAVKRRGRELVACEVPWRMVRSTAEGILVETGDRQLGEVRLAGVNALDIRRMAPKDIKL